MTQCKGSPRDIIAKGYTHGFHHWIEIVKFLLPKNQKKEWGSTKVVIWVNLFLWYSFGNKNKLFWFWGKCDWLISVFFHRHLIPQTAICQLWHSIMSLTDPLLCVMAIIFGIILEDVLIFKNITIINSHIVSSGLGLVIKISLLVALYFDI